MVAATLWIPAYVGNDMKCLHLEGTYKTGR